MFEGFLPSVLYMYLEPIMVKEIETKKLNLFNPFNQAIVSSELKIVILFTAREIDGVVLVSTDKEFPMAAPDKDVSEYNLKILTALIQTN